MAQRKARINIGGRGGKRQQRPDDHPGPDYRDIPALAKYIYRVGAEQRNFRRFIVTEWHEQPNGRRYYEQKAVITIEADGTPTCSVAEFAPTKEEANDI